MVVGTGTAVSLAARLVFHPLAVVVVVANAVSSDAMEAVAYWDVQDFVGSLAADAKVSVHAASGFMGFLARGRG